MEAVLRIPKECASFVAELVFSIGEEKGESDSLFC
jgi:hypothetical protein